MASLGSWLHLQLRFSGHIPMDQYINLSLGRKGTTRDAVLEKVQQSAAKPEPQLGGAL